MQITTPVPRGSFARPHAHRARSQTAANSPSCASTHGCHPEFAPGMGAPTGTRARRGLCSHPSCPCIPLCGRYGVGAQPRLGRRVARAVRQEETTGKKKTTTTPFSLNVEGFKNFVSFSFFREPKGWVLKCPAAPLYPRAPGGSDLSALQPLGAGDRARLRRFAGQPGPDAADRGVSNPPSIAAPKVLLHLGQSSCFASSSGAVFAAQCGSASLHPMAGR